MKPYEKFKVLNSSGTLTHCPFCNHVNDDSREMIDHIRDTHNQPSKLCFVKSLEKDKRVMHIVELL